MTARLKFKPRSTFNADLKRLASVDRSIIQEVRESIDLLLETGSLPAEFGDHELSKKYSGYREFHLRDTPANEHPDDINDVLVIYRIDMNELVLIGVRVGSHNKLFANQNSSKNKKT